MPANSNNINKQYITRIEAVMGIVGLLSIIFVTGFSNPDRFQTASPSFFFEFFVTGFSNPNTFIILWLILLIPVCLKFHQVRYSFIVLSEVLLLCVFFHSVSGKYPSYRLLNIIYPALLSIIFMFYYSLKTPGKFLEYLKPFLWIILIVCLYKGFYQYFAGFDEILEYAKTSTDLSPIEKINIISRVGQKRIFSFFVLPSMYAEFLLIALCFLAYIVQENKSRITCISALVLFVLSLISLLMTRSISGILTGTIILFVYFFLYYRAGRLKKIIVLSVVILICFLPAFYLIKYKRGEYRGGFSGSPVALRLMNWENSIFLFSESPLFGKGAGMFRIYFPQIKQKSSMETRHAHSWYLETASEYGIFITGGLILLVLSLIINVLKNNSCILPAISVLIFPVMNFFDLSYYIPSSAGLWAMMCGLFLGHARDDDYSYQTGQKNILPRVVLLIILNLIILKIWVGEEYIINIPQREQKQVKENIHTINELAPYKSMNVFLEGYFHLTKPPSKENPMPYVTGLRLIEKAKNIEPFQGRMSYYLANEFGAKHQYDAAYVEAVRAHRIYPGRGDYVKIKNEYHKKFYK